mmetsp:Transcript_13811/g.37320  ORF Transcript_13811/g.37320 Transcript_13811/m.37320 type:complete len:411 (+) Transcript_13811:123-1355(+)
MDKAFGRLQAKGRKAGGGLDLAQWDNRDVQAPEQPAGTDKPDMRSSKAESTSSHASSSLQDAIASELLYCLVSAGTTLFNKHVLSTFAFPAPNVLLFFQFLLAVVLLRGLHALRIITLAPLRWDMVKLWMPVNLIFVLMNVTGFLALQAIGAGMFTVLKNLSNLMTICGDYFLYGNTYSMQVWFCLLLMIVSAVVGGWTDLRFSASGYAWQLVNCCLTAAYSLHLSGVIKTTSQKHHGKQQLSEMSMVYYNNLLSVPPLGVLAIVSMEPWSLRGYPYWGNREFQVFAVLGGLMGFAVSFASIWCMARTSPTIYSLTGSLNKVVVALVGMWYFKESSGTANATSIWLGLAAGFLFVFAKQASPGSASGRQAASAGLKENGTVNSPKGQDLSDEGSRDEEVGLLGGSRKSHG